jgi:hypothetical protein
LVGQSAAFEYAELFFSDINIRKGCLQGEADPVLCLFCTSTWAEQALLIDGMGLTLLQLCQNYMYLCVRIGKIDRVEAPSNA